MSPLHDPLRRLTNVRLSPHLGFVTEPVFQRFATDVTECLQAWLTGLILGLTGPTPTYAWGRGLRPAIHLKRKLLRNRYFSGLRR